MNQGPRKRMYKTVKTEFKKAEYPERSMNNLVAIFSVQITLMKPDLTHD
jgi:hypothetical protein